MQGMHPILLVYFGYTNCPDECPTTMADLGIALRTLVPSEQAEIQVAFVTTDPDRDRPMVLKKWLAHFDTGLAVPFVGLNGSVSETDSIGNELGVPLQPPKVLADGSIDVEHGTQVLAFVRDTARLVWLAGTTPDDYAHDLTLLAQTSHA
ncbi:MAG TPA: SCO family protein [Jatrophihabitans sp.]|jgi:protein SCO1/2